MLWKWGIRIILAVVVAYTLLTYYVPKARINNTVNAWAGCDDRWYSAPPPNIWTCVAGSGYVCPIPTNCGSVSYPMGAGIANLTPNFNWNYGGYRSGETTCTQPSGCAYYGAALYLSVGSPSNQPFGSGWVQYQTSPPTSFNWSDIKVCNYNWPGDPGVCHTDNQPTIAPLSPNTTYYWSVTPYICSGIGSCIPHTGAPWSYWFSTVCNQTTCAAQGKNCGTIPNGCGGTLNCGTCTAPNTCGGGGTANVCGCTTTTCAALGANCGTVYIGCNQSADCGTCAAPNTCGGGGTANVCGCTQAQPSPVTLVSPENNFVSYDSNVILAWNAESNWGQGCVSGCSNSYDLYFGTTNPPPLYQAGLPASQTYFQLTGLAFNTPYYWNVRANNCSLQGTWAATTPWVFTVFSRPWLQVYGGDVFGSNVYDPIQPNCGTGCYINMNSP